MKYSVSENTTGQTSRRQYRFSLRARLSFLYGAAFFLAGALLIGVNYELVRQNLQDHRVDLVVVEGPNVNPDEIVIPTPELARKIAQREAAERRAALSELLRESIFALIIIGVLAGILGYWMASQALRPVHRITSAARRVAQGNLREHIVLPGPDDEVKELADTFNHMVKRLDAAFSSQQRFVANASHELRTPLATTRTVLEVAMSAPDASEDLKETGEKLLTVNSRSEKLIDGLLTLARSEHELSERKAADLASVAEQVSALLADEYARVGVRLEQQLANAPVSGSPVLLERLMVNLLQNAARYNHPDGWAQIRTGILEGWSTVEVKNSGKIIAPETVEQLFEPFHRGTGSRTKRQGGAGLGLSIVRAIARTHGGGTAAWPNPGGGLVVRAWFPVAARLEASSSHKSQ